MEECERREQALDTLQTDWISQSIRLRQQVDENLEAIVQLEETTRAGHQEWDRLLKQDQENLLKDHDTLIKRGRYLEAARDRLQTESDRLVRNYGLRGFPSRLGWPQDAGLYAQGRDGGLQTLHRASPSSSHAPASPSPQRQGRATDTPTQQQHPPSGLWRSSTPAAAPSVGRNESSSEAAAEAAAEVDRRLQRLSVEAQAAADAWQRAIQFNYNERVAELAATRKVPEGDDADEQL